MSTVLYSKEIIQEKQESLKDECDLLIKAGKTPKMRVFLVGNHPASEVYIRNKKRFCEKIGALFELVRLDSKINEKDFMEELEKANKDSSVTGTFVQLPVPKQLQHIDITNLITPKKDVDGFHKDNIFKIFRNEEGALLPCTPKGILTILKKNNIELCGKRVAVIGRSFIVGKPMAMLLTNQNATVTHCHSKTQNLEAILLEQDIIISAVGLPKFLGAKHFRSDQSQIVIDVGMNQDDNGKLCGDVDFATVKDQLKAITPVPGGVGPMTVLSLMENLIQATKNQ
jgi:methylenetetrahydrofolate dehydrogenase (NADP+)/methenyltetrahydrofolate cyclohydrolase